MTGAALACIVLAFFGAMSVGRLSHLNEPDAWRLMLASLATLATGLALLLYAQHVERRRLRARDAAADALLRALMDAGPQAETPEDVARLALGSNVIDFPQRPTPSSWRGKSAA